MQSCSVSSIEGHGVAVCDSLECSCPLSLNPPPPPPPPPPPSTGWNLVQSVSNCRLINAIACTGASSLIICNCGLGSVRLLCGCICCQLPGLQMHRRLRSATHPRSLRFAALDFWKCPWQTNMLGAHTALDNPHAHAGSKHEPPLRECRKYKPCQSQEHNLRRILLFTL